MTRSVRCLVCQHSDIDKIEDSVVIGGRMVRHVARQHHLAETSLRRHMSRHVDPDLHRAARESTGLRASSFVARLSQLADHAAEVGAVALQRGNVRTAVAALDSERATLIALLDRLNIDGAAAADELAEAAALVGALGQMLHAHPEFGPPMSEALRARNQHTLAAAIDARASTARAAAAATAPALAVLGAPALTERNTA